MAEYARIKISVYGREEMTSRCVTVEENPAKVYKKLNAVINEFKDWEPDPRSQRG